MSVISISRTHLNLCEMKLSDQGERMEQRRLRDRRFGDHLFVWWQKLLESVRVWKSNGPDYLVYTQAKPFTIRHRGFNRISESKEEKKLKVGEES